MGHSVTTGIRIVPAFTCLVLSASLSVPLLAQSSGPLEELVVTARKREQNLQDVAVGVSLLSGKALAEAQLRNSADLSTLIPTLNVQASSGPSTSSFNIRGIGTQAFSTAVEPSVSTMLDGVVMSNSGMAFLDLVDVERVEVLRGPQGTLYGKNSSAGVIHIITRDPTPELSGTVEATYIEDDEYRLNGTVSGPLSDTLSYRLTGSAIDDGGFGENRFNGDTINSRENYTLRGKLLWQPSAELEFLWSSDYGDHDCECNYLSVRDIRESTQQQMLLEEQLPVVPSEDNQDVNNNQPTFSNITASGHSLSIDWQLYEHTLTSISAYRNWQSEGIVDLDNRPSNPLALTFPMPPESDLDQYSQELRLTSPLADWGSYVIGAYYFSQDIDSGNDTTTSLFAPFAPPTTRVTRTQVDSDNIALFGELSYNISDTLQLAVGARYTEEKLKYHTTAVGTDNLIFPPEGDVRNSLQDSELSPRVALQWQVTEQAMTYLSYTEGYKGPAFDTSVIAAETVVAPETSDAWEMGLKSNWLDSRLILNLALFYADYKDFQAQALFDPNPNDQLPGGFLLVNAGEVSTKGVELEFFARPGDNWTVNGGIAYTDGTIEEYPMGNCSAGQEFRGECPMGYQDLSGGQLPYTPKWKLNLSASYRLPLENYPLEWVFGADLRAQDDVLYEISQDEYTRQDAYSIVDVRVSLAEVEGGFRVTAFAKNLFDEDYASLIFAQAQELIPHGYIHYVPKYANRTLGLAVQYDF
ncbi:MAG: TonB-dependent receptor [Halioglobus sp.]